jgi:predicted metal-binding membrane protein
MADMTAMAMPQEALAFLGMWTLMMLAMMLPSLVPMLWRLRQPAWLTAWVGAGYFIVWTVLGLIAFLVIQVPSFARAGPLAGGVVVLLAGAWQCTSWKARHLACCRGASYERSPRKGAGTALRYGLRLGFHCSCCCAGATAIMFVSGLMDLRAMALATVAITAERLAPSGERVARLIGVIVVGVGLSLVARAAFSHPSRSCAAARCGSGDAACAAPWLLFDESARG